MNEQKLVNSLVKAWSELGKAASALREQGYTIHISDVGRGGIRFPTDFELSSDITVKKTNVITLVPQKKTHAQNSKIRTLNTNDPDYDVVMTEFLSVDPPPMTKTEFAAMLSCEDAVKYCMDLRNLAFPEAVLFMRKEIMEMSRYE